MREVEYGRVTESELASEVRRIARRETYILQKLESTEKQVYFLTTVKDVLMSWREHKRKVVDKFVFEI